MKKSPGQAFMEMALCIAKMRLASAKIGLKRAERTKPSDLRDDFIKLFGRGIEQAQEEIEELGEKITAMRREANGLVEIVK